MADKPLNQVTKVTDLSKVKTFLAVMDDNTIQQMSKEDMATVVGGLVTTDNKFRKYFNRIGHTSSDDFNDYYPEEGVTIYACGGFDTVNGPVSKPFGVIFSCNVDADAPYGIQIFYGFNGHIYYRHNKTTSWITVV